ncbi:MAG TPA: hypothetical protein VF412_12670 [Bdellovibrio sp.]|uniref:hypothetical protein n=1 Tax=Bdellovibrio sp. TaxID=28201 RepID=UPI002F032562
MSRSILFSAFLLIITGCVTTPTKDQPSLEQRIQSEQQANTPEEIAQRAADVFSSTPGLSDEQRTKLHALYLKTYADSRQIMKEIGQMKSLMFKEAATKKFDSKDMMELTHRIVEADQRRLNLMFSAFAEMQNIIGYGEDKKELYERLRNYDYPGRALR